MKISELSDETLRLVCSYLDSYDVLKVWLLGCHLLNAKLIAPRTIENLECLVDSSTFGQNFLPLPSLRSLSLSPLRREIEYKVAYDDNYQGFERQHVTLAPLPPSQISSIFSSLPRSLTSLSSHVRLDYVYFMEAFLSGQSLLPTLRNLDLGGCVSFRGSENRQLWPSNLTSLSLKEDYDIIENYKDATRVVLAVETLPTSLERLKCFGLYIAPLAFPPALTELSIITSVLACGIIPYLPTGLTKLTLKPSHGGEGCDWNFSRLPPSLTHLSCSLSPAVLDQTFIDAMAQALRLTTLEMDVLPETFENPKRLFRTLPPHLETFQTSDYNFNFEDCIQGVELPKSLTRFEVVNTVSAWDELLDLPASCTSLVLDMSQLNLAEEDLKYDEPSPRLLKKFTQLRTLAICYAPSDVKTLFSALPPHVTTLYCQDLFLTSEELEDLSKTQVSTLAFLGQPDDPTPTIDNYYFSSLPCSLTSLSIDIDAKYVAKCQERQDFVQRFPETLKSLTLKHFTVSGDRWLKMLPNGLKDLSLKWEENESVQFWEPTWGNDAHSPFLPPSLTRVELQMRMSSRVILLGILGSIQRLEILKELELVHFEEDESGAEPETDASHTTQEQELMFEKQDLRMLPNSTRRVRLNMPHKIATHHAHLLPPKCHLFLEKAKIETIYY